MAIEVNLQTGYKLVNGTSVAYKYTNGTDITPALNKFTRATSGGYNFYINGFAKSKDEMYNWIRTDTVLLFASVVAVNTKTDFPGWSYPVNHIVTGIGYHDDYQGSKYVYIIDPSSEVAGNSGGGFKYFKKDDFWNYHVENKWMAW